MTRSLTSFSCYAVPTPFRSSKLAQHSTKRSLNSIVNIYSKPHLSCLVTIFVPGPGESITDFLSQLELLAKKCTITSVTAIQHRELLLADAFVAGLLSMPIKQSLLKSAAIQLWKTATSMELVTKSAKLLGASSDTSPVFGTTSKMSTP